MNSRNNALDYLRIYSMIGVIGLHVVGACQVTQERNLMVQDSILAFFWCSVNLFALLSGYLKWHKKPRLESIVNILVITLFWSIVITSIAIFLGQVEGSQQIRMYYFPYLSERMWYITCYCFLFFCTPTLNYLIQNMPQASLKNLLFWLTLLMSGVTTFLYRDAFHVVSNGYSAGWLIYLYLVGGYIGKYQIELKRKKLACGMLALSCAVMVASKVVMHKTGIDIFASLLYRYSSPCVLLNSLIIFLVVKGRTEWKANTKIKVLANVALGVYVIHAHPVMLDLFFTNDRFGYLFSNTNILLVLLKTVVTCIAVYAVCGFLELVRQRLFDKSGLNGIVHHMVQVLDRFLYL